MTTLALGIAQYEELARECESSAESPSQQVVRAFREHHKPVYNFLYGMLVDRSAAEDLCQEAFLRMFRELHRSAISNHRAWVFRVASNLALSYNKRRSRALNALDIGEDVWPDAAPDPEEALLRNESRHLLSAAMARLSTQERQCLLLRSEGLRYREIADVLNIRVSTVATFVTRAVRKLAEDLHA